MKKIALLILGTLFVTFSFPLVSWAGTCPNSFPNIANDICWKCILPIKIGSKRISTKKGFNEFDPNGSSDPSTMMCFCGEAPNIGVGLWFSWWEPYLVMENTRKPYCLSFLYGKTVKVKKDYLNPDNSHVITSIKSSYTYGGTGKLANKNKAFYNVHVYSFPLTMIMDLLVSPGCSTSGFITLDVVDLSEFNTLWNNDLASFAFAPEAAFFSNPLVVASCAADCVAAMAGFGLNTMSWCGGCDGLLYPQSGSTNPNSSPVRITSLLTQRMLARRHRFGLEFKTIGKKAKCGGYYFPVLPKNQYKISMIFPVPESSSSKKKISGMFRSGKCCHPLGRHTFMWGEERTIPGTGEDYVYLVWRRMDCCVR